MKDVIQDAMNEQLNAELYASHLYLAMSARFEDLNFPGFAHWMRAQSEEERDHAMRFYEFIDDRGGSVQVSSLDEPTVSFKTPVEAFQAALDHERKVTGAIHDLYELAETEKDYATHPFLEEFIKEQVEEEKTAQGIVDRLEMIGDDPSGLLLLDQQLGSRTGEAE